MLKQLYGPNSLTHLSAKKNQDILLPIASLLTSDQITEYIEGTLIEQFDVPDLTVYYSDDEAGVNKVADFQKQMQIKLFVVSQASSILT